MVLGAAGFEEKLKAGVEEGNGEVVEGAKVEVAADDRKDGGVAVDVDGEISDIMSCGGLEVVPNVAAIVKF